MITTVARQNKSKIRNIHGFSRILHVANTAKDTMLPLARIVDWFHENTLFIKSLPVGQVFLRSHERGTEGRTYAHCVHIMISIRFTSSGYPRLSISRLKVVREIEIEICS